MSARVAFFTLGALKEPFGADSVQGFVDRAAAVYAAADGSTGFFARSIRDLKTWEHSWGGMVIPKCVPHQYGLNQLAMTLSVWRDLESIVSFSYRGVHGEALTRRNDWFERGPWPNFVAWWIDEHHQPSWVEAAERADMLQAKGCTPEAFNFRQPFDASGQPVKLDRSRIIS